MTYREKTELLRKEKERQTLEKVEKYKRNGFMDTDDKGYIVPPDDWHWEPKYREGENCYWGNKLCAENFASLLDSFPTYIDPNSSLAGAYYYKMEWAKNGFPHCWDEELKELRETSAKYGLKNGLGSTHHFNHDIENIGLPLGFGGLLKKIEHYRDLYSEDPEKVEFLEAEITVVKAIQRWISRHADGAEELSKTETDPEKRENLIRMAAMNRKLVNDKPEHFVEVCQFLLWFTMATAVYNGSGAGGILETLLSPYYYKDVADGILTYDEAVYHLACLFVRETMYYEIGGVYPDGRDRTNEISYAAIEAAHWLKVPTALCLRIHEGIDRDFVRKSVEYLFEDRTGNPAYLGDACMVEGFMRNGYTAEIARLRSKTGCNWCALPGTEYTANDTVKINMARIFEIAFWEMLGSGERSVSRLWELFDKHMDIAIKCLKDCFDWHLDNWHIIFPELALDFACHGPIERGTDIVNHGVDNYNMCIDGAGLGTVADSFAACEQAVERDGLLTWDELADCLKNNWEGREDIRNLMRNVPHYGAGGTRGDYYAKKIVFDSLVKHVKKCPTPEGRNCIPGLFSWANTIGMGKAVGATPNGRYAGKPITHGANPEPGFRESGALTAMGIAVAGVQPMWGNTAPIQLEIDPALGSNEDGVERITNFLMTYCVDLKGSLVNINILDKEKILDAHKHPESHPDLIVRVTGFSAYFNTLSEEFRQLVVDRIIEG